jgi:membrane-bound ClpP family serine protease
MSAPFFTIYPLGRLRSPSEHTKFDFNKEEVMLAAIGAVLLVLWLLGFVAFHVTVGAIHLLLVIAVVLFVAHLLTGRSAAA